MRKIVVNGILGGAMGGMLSFMGFPFTTWQFWVVIFIFMATVINSQID